MSDKKTEIAQPTDKNSATGDGVKKSGVIGGDANQSEYQKAHKKSHSNDKGPSQLEAPAVQSFGIDGLDTAKKPNHGGKFADSAWLAEKDGDWMAGWQSLAGTEQEKAVIARRHFLKLLDENEKNTAEKQQVIDAMHKFEKLHRTNPKEIKEFYEQVSKTMDKSSGKAVSQDLRVVLAEQTILQAASPDLIRQGDHKTCNVSTIEHRLYSRHPAAAAKVIADLALDGRWESGDTHVNLNWHRDNFIPEKGTDNLNLGNDRSYASQLFQIGAVNAHYAEERTYEYYQTVNKRTGIHEEVLEGDGGRQYKPNLTADELIDVYNKIAHTNEVNFILTADNSPNSDKCLKFKSQEELGNFLFKHQKDMPLILAVHTANEPFWSEGQAGSDTGEPHVVTIKSYDPVKHTVAIHNQWGLKSDHSALPLTQIYNSTMSPGGTINRLQHLEDNNKISVSEKLDLARLRWVYDAQVDNNAQFGQDLIDCMKDARTRWKTQHISAEEQSRDQLKYRKILDLLSGKMYDNGALINHIKKEVGH